MNLFKLNGKSIVAKPFDFNLVCDLEDMGVSLDDLFKKPMSMVRAYVSACVGCAPEVAGEEMEAHIISGGNFQEIIDMIAKLLEESDFFRALGQNGEKKSSASKKKGTKEAESKALTDIGQVPSEK